MISYEVYHQIKDLAAKGLCAAQISTHLGLDPRTVRDHLDASSYRGPKKARRPSKLDSYRGKIQAWLEQHPYTAAQILIRLQQEGYTGGYSILKKYVSEVRPRTMQAYLSLTFLPGQCAQVDWGHAGVIQVGSVKRRLSFFVMVLAHSRYLYVEFTLGQGMEFWLSAHRRAFEYFGAVPAEIWIDNLKTGVVSHPRGQPAIFHPHYQELAKHYDFKIVACAVHQPQQKGRVENAVGYVRSSLINGWNPPCFTAIEPMTLTWLRTVANVRKHAQTGQQPAELFATEKASLKALPARAFDPAIFRPARANRLFRVAVDANTYSVPPQYAGQNLQLRLTPDKVQFYHAEKLIAEHVRSFDKHRDIQDPDHVSKLLEQRKQGVRQRELMEFLRLGPCAETYLNQLKERWLDVHVQIRRILAMVPVYGVEAVHQAMNDSLPSRIPGADYLQNILYQRCTPQCPPMTPLHLTHGSELLKIQPQSPDLSIYDKTLNKELQS